MNTYLYYVIAFLVSALCALVLCAVVSTQLVLADIVSFGVAVSIEDRLDATVHDIFGLLPMFGPLLAIALMLGFVVAGLIVRFSNSKRLLWYCLAGAAAFVTMILLMRLSLNLTPLAAARTPIGLGMIAMSCAVAGVIFHYLTVGRYTERQSTSREESS